jgi:hypothetical protein
VDYRAACGTAGGQTVTPFNRNALAAVAFAACVPELAVAADGLGRLFFTPAQRTQLDTARAQRDRRGPITAESEPTPAQGPDVVTYSGVVRRNDGKTTVWINGKPITERTRGNDVSVSGVRNDGAISVAVPQAARSTSLRVGQSVDVASGTIEEPYTRRATIPRSQANSAPAANSAGAPATAAPARATPPQRAVQRGEKDSDPDSGAAPARGRGAQSTAP